jgi:hypothetical protein
MCQTRAGTGHREDERGECAHGIRAYALPSAHIVIRFRVHLCIGVGAHLCSREFPPLQCLFSHIPYQER